MTQNELMHYGVPGMKWGKRKTQTSNNYTARVARGHAGPGKYLTPKRQLAGDKKDLEILNKGGHLSVGLTKKRQEAYDKRDRAAIEKHIQKNKSNNIKSEYRKERDRQNKRDAYKAAKAERKAKIKETTKELNKKASFGEKLTYNDATRKAAAKYIVDNNMSVSEATKKAKGEALRNTAIYVTAVGAYTVASLYKMNH